MKTTRCTRSLLIPVVIAMAVVFSPVELFVQKKKSKEEEKTEGIDTGLLSGLKWRGIGPGLTSGRVADFAVNPENQSEWYVAIASGNVWKTVNNGTTFKPV
ncbi:MAG: hypothetical protein KAS29_20825, partial [Bacteroidales bacterium]|nr:hypothetical protein [Bacteroidales bacterium]